VQQPRAEQPLRTPEDRRATPHGPGGRWLWQKLYRMAQKKNDIVFLQRV
jgi:hypothetical protein